METTKNMDSDVIPGVYEGSFDILFSGGLKSWECSLDLRNYIKEHFTKMNDERILEVFPNTISRWVAGLGNVVAFVLRLEEGFCFRITTRM